MPNVCIICKKLQGKHKVAFHRFPKDVDLCNVWIQNCALTDTNRLAHKTVCSDHFDPACYVVNTNRLIKNSAPKILTPVENTLKTEHQMTPDTFFRPVDLIPKTPEVHDISPSCSRNCSNPSILSNCSMPDLSTSSDCSTPLSSDSETLTGQILTRNTPKKKKLKERVTELETQLISVIKERNKLKAMTIDLQERLKAPISLADFHRICDNFIPGKITLCNFIKNQVQLCTQNEIERRKHTSEEKQFALMIHFHGPKVYRFLQNTFCLPSIRTLQRTTKNWEIGVGLSDFVFKILSLKSQSLSVTGRDCVLCADEISLKAFLYYNYAKDEIIGFHCKETHKTAEVAKSVMVLMMRGLHNSWKQPIGYYFVDSTCTGFILKNIIFNCISKLNNINFNVKVMISDMGSNFKSFADTIGVTPDNPYFMVGKLEIIYMFDTPHLIKSTRNNFFTYRFVSGDNTIESKYLKQFYDADVIKTHRLAPKLTEKHMNPVPFQKMKVKYASQVFSKTVSSAMSSCMTDGSLSIEASQTIQFIDSMNNLFDIFNSQAKVKPQEADIDSDDKHLGEKRFGSPFTNVDHQEQFLLSMFNFLKNLKIQKFNISKNQWINVNKSSNTQFLKGWMISIAGLMRLHDTLSREHNTCIEIMTRRLNKEFLQNFIGTMCINPTTIQFQRTFKKIFCLNYFEYDEGANCLEDVEEILTNLSKTSRDESQIIFPENDANAIKIKPLLIDGTHYRLLEFQECNSITYICSYLISETLNIHSCDTCLEYARTTTTLSNDVFSSYFKSHKNYSSVFSVIMTPDSEFYNYVLELNTIFTDKFSNFAILPNVGQKLKTRMLSVFFQHPCNHFSKDYLLNLFIRFRIYTTLTKTNRTLQIPCIKNRKLQILSNL